MKKLIIILMAAFTNAVDAQDIFDGTSLTAGGSPLGIFYGMKMVPGSKLFSYLYSSGSKNIAIAGSCMEKKPASYKGSFNVAAGADKIATLKKPGEGKKYFIEFGANDILYGSPYSTANFIKDFSAYVAKVISLGVPPKDIVIFYNYAIPKAGYDFYHKKVGMPVPDQNRLNKYEASILSIIKRFGTDSFNVGGILLDVPLADRGKIFMSDSLHPNELGHWYIAQALIRKFKTKEPPVLPLFDTIRTKVYYPMNLSVTHDSAVIRDSIRVTIQPRVAAFTSVLPNENFEMLYKVAAILNRQRAK